MSWRYDVHTCNNRSAETGAHDGDCWGWRRVGMFSDSDWPAAFILAERMAHGQVLRIYTGADAWGPGSVTDVFEHRVGGGPCGGGCTGNRALMVSCAGSPRFRCAWCIKSVRELQLRLFGRASNYPSVIDGAMEAATRRHTDLVSAALKEARR